MLEWLRNTMSVLLWSWSPIFHHTLSLNHPQDIFGNPLYSYNCRISDMRLGPWFQQHWGILRTQKTFLVTLYWYYCGISGNPSRRYGESWDWDPGFQQDWAIPRTLRTVVSASWSLDLVPVNICVMAPDMKFDFWKVNLTVYEFPVHKKCFCFNSPPQGVCRYKGPSFSRLFFINVAHQDCVVDNAAKSHRGTL